MMGKSPGGVRCATSATDIPRPNKQEAAVVDSGLESLITGSSELEQLGVVRSCRLLDVTLPFNNFKVPGCLSHVESEDRPGQFLQSGARLAGMLLLGSVDMDSVGVESQEVNSLLYCALRCCFIVTILG